WFTDNFLGSITEDALSAFVPTGNNALQSLGDDRVVGEIDYGGEAGAEFVLVFLRGDIARDLRGADYFSVRIANRRDTERDVQQSAILAPTDSLIMIDSIPLAQAGENSRF